jgi:hypothetical protein
MNLGLIPQNTIDPIRKYVYVPNWEVLLALGRAKSMRTLLAWVVIVPIIARCISEVPEEVRFSIPCFEKVEGTFLPQRTKKPIVIPIKLSLPFSWKFLYFGGIAFLAGNLMVHYFCPRVLRDPPVIGPNLSNAEIGDLLAEIVMTHPSGLFGGFVWCSNSEYWHNYDFLNSLKKVYSPGEDLPLFKAVDPRLSVQWSVSAECSPPSESHQINHRLNALDYARQTGRWSAYYPRLIVVLLYVFAAFSIGWVGIQNFLFVYNYGANTQ